MLVASGCSDVELPDLVASGFYITGEVAPSGVFPSSFVPATSHVNELRSLAGPAAAVAYAETKSPGDPEIDQKLGRKPWKRKRRAGSLDL